MFWGKNKNQKNKKPKDQKDKRGRSKKGEAANIGNSVGNKKGHGDRAEIQAQAMANFSAAREQIGEDTLNRIAAAMTKKQQSAMERAKRDIAGADVDKVLDELKWMLDNKDS